MRRLTGAQPVLVLNNDAQSKPSAESSISVC